MRATDTSERRISEALNFGALLQAIFRQQACDYAFTEEELNRMLDLAYRHEVYELVVQQVLHDASQPARRSILGESVKVEQLKTKNAYQQKELSQFAHLMARREIAVRVLKGAVFAACYPEPLLRYSCDIDYYCDARHYPLALAEMQQRMKHQVETHMSRKHAQYVFRHLHYEQHSILAELVVPAHARALQAAIDEDMATPYYIEVEGQLVPTFSPTLNLYHLYVHFFFHLISSGAHAKQLLDAAFFMKAHQDEVDADRLRRLLKATGMWKGFLWMGRILITCIGLPPEYFPFSLPMDEAAELRAKKDFADLLFPVYRRRFRQSLLHALETAYIVTRHTFRYAALCPSEVGVRLPALVLWSGVCKPFRLLRQKSRA